MILVHYENVIDPPRRGVSANIPESRCWPEDYSDENGSYHGRCPACGEVFIGHKRRVVCRECDTGAKGKGVARAIFAGLILGVVVFLFCVALGAAGDPQDSPHLHSDAEIAQMERDLRDAYEDRRKDAQDAGDDVERQHWLIQRRAVQLAISNRVGHDRKPPVIDPPIVLPPDPPTDGGWLAPEPDADAIRLDADTTEAEARAAINSERDVLFAAGAVYDYSLGQLWRGGTEDDPRLIGVYGDGPRPQFRVSSTWLHTRGGDRISHIAIVGLRVTNLGRVPGPDFDANAKSTVGISWLAGGGDLLIEDCVFEGLRFGITFDPQDDATIEGLTLNRCIVRNCWDDGGDSSGAFIKAVRDGEITECVFDHNGWLEGAAPRDDRRHNLYLAPRPNDSDPRAFPWIVRGNLFSNGSSHGMKGGPGGTVEDNLWVGNAIAFYVSRNDSTVRGNVILAAADLGPTDALARGWGFEAFGMGRVTVENNIVANQQSHRPEASAAYAIDTHGITGNVSGNHVYAQPRGRGDVDGVVYHADRLSVPDGLGAMIDREVNRPPGVWLGGVSDYLEATYEVAQ